MSDFSVGDRLPPVSMTPSALQLFRYSAVTWNMHRIHYDRGWATHEGHAGLLVHSHLHAANAIRALTDGLGPDWHVATVGYRVIRPATEGTTLTATAEVTGIGDDGDRIDFAISETDGEGNVCLQGTACATRRSGAAR